MNLFVHAQIVRANFASPCRVLVALKVGTRPGLYEKSTGSSTRATGSRRGRGRVPAGRYARSRPPNALSLSTAARQKPRKDREIHFGPRSFRRHLKHRHRLTSAANRILANHKGLLL